MRYLLMLYADEKAGVTIPPEEMAKFMGQLAAYQQALEEANAFVATEALDLAANASVVRMRDGAMQVQDGPYAEAREQFGGYFIIDVADDDAARHWAARCPAAGWGAIEVRRIRDASEYS